MCNAANAAWVNSTAQHQTQTAQHFTFWFCPKDSGRNRPIASPLFLNHFASYIEINPYHDRFVYIANVEFGKRLVEY